MSQGTKVREWRRYGFGGPPEPWPHGAQIDLDRLATSYFVDILEYRAQVLSREPEPDLWQKVEELCTTATRHKQEIDYTLRHWATPAEQARVEERLGSLMRISHQLHVLIHGPLGPSGSPEAA